MSVARLAEAVGMDKGQISPALAGLVSRKLVSRAVNPRDNREVLVCLTRTGLVANDAMVAGALERNQRLLEQLGKEEVAVLLGHVDRLTDAAADMLDAERDLNRPEFGRLTLRRGTAGRCQNCLSCAACCAALSLRIIPM
jgi:hypothetical protein